jgi:O-antigen/teichoic acid export membrane protein
LNERVRNHEPTENRADAARGEEQPRQDAPVTPSMSGSLKERAYSGVRWTVSARLLVQLITWPATIIVMRLLDPHDYGLVAISTVVIGFVTLFGEPGLAAGLVHTHVPSTETSRAASALLLLLNLLLLAALVLAAPRIAAWYHQPELERVIQVSSLSLLMTAIATVPQAHLERNLRFKEIALALIIGNVVGTLVTIVCALFGFGVWSLVIGTLVLSALRSIVVIAYNRSPVWPDFSLGLKPVRHLMHFSLHVLGNRILWYCAMTVDVVILGRMVGSRELGSYSVGSNLAAIPGDKAMEAVNRVSFPTLSRMRPDRSRFNNTYERIMSVLALYGFMVAWALAAVAPEFVQVVLSDKWRAAVVPLSMLAIAAPLRILTAFQNTVNNAAGFPQANTRVSVLTCLALPAGIFVGARIDGIDGAAVSWVVVYAVLYLVSTVYTCRVTQRDVRDDLRLIVVPLLAGIAMLVVTRVLRVLPFAQLPPALLLGVEIIAAAVVFLGTVHLLAPADLGDARVLLRALLRPDKAAGIGITS